MHNMKLSRGLIFLLATGTACLLSQTAGAAKKGSYAVVTVENGGTIEGKVTWSGPKPKLAPFPINKNPEVCDPKNTGDRPTARLVVDEKGGVQHAVVFLEGISQGKSLPEGPFVFDQKDCRYSPHIMVVPKKSKVTLKSSDSILHNIHMFGAATYNIPFPKPIELEKKLRKSGLVRVQCDAGHGWMSAYIHVVEHPYYAVTAADGSFKLTDVPPGKYELHMWHESWVITGTTEKDGKPATYTFAEPLTDSKDIEVSAGGTATINFSLASKT